MPYWRLVYHLVWATKERQPLIGEAEERAIRHSIMMTIGDLGLLARAIGLMPDHVHVLADGRIVRSGGADLARELEREGYAGVLA